MDMEKSQLVDGTSAKNRDLGDTHVASSMLCFDCNICLEPVVEPVVTLCGHLYCWPCVYRWLKSDQQGSRQCPVCKAAISKDRVVPLYGRGIMTDAAACKGSIRIPSRPSAPNIEHLHPSDGNSVYFNIQAMPRHGHQLQQYGYYNYNDTDYRSWAPVFHSNAGCVLGGMAVAILPWAFRGGIPALPSALHRNRLYVGDWRVARRQRQAESWLHQMWFFLAVFAVLCFLLF